MKYLLVFSLFLTSCGSNVDTHDFFYKKMVEAKTSKNNESCFGATNWKEADGIYCLQYRSMVEK